MKVNVAHLAKLVNMPLKPDEEKKLQSGFDSTLKAVDKLKQLTVGKTKSTFQVTKLNNVWREDKLQPERGLTQKQALSQAKRTYKGFFVVSRVINYEA
jgi:aspartyl/glutamyl-tRNA(Asn/Gln) amidotransferase C subunit